LKLQKGFNQGSPAVKKRGGERKDNRKEKSICNKGRNDRVIIEISSKDGKALITLYYLDEYLKTP